MAELRVEKTWTDGGQLLLRVACEDREKLTDGCRAFATAFVGQPENGLTAWAGAGAEKAECPLAYDPDHPEMDITEANDLARKEGRTVKWIYTQVVRLTRGI